MIDDRNILFFTQNVYILLFQYGFAISGITYSTEKHFHSRIKKEMKLIAFCFLLKVKHVCVCLCTRFYLQILEFPIS